MKFSRILILSFLLVSLVLTPNIQMGRAAQVNNSDSLSLILMIGDGLGFEHVKLARWIEVGKDSNLTMESILNHDVTTSSANAQVTDSAASATAIATGVKTNNGWVAIAPTGTVLETILEKVQLRGKSTGVITTTEIQQATPAAFMTHVESRNDYSTITQQIIENVGVNVLMGGGKLRFSEAQLDLMIANGYTLVENKTSMEGITSGNILGLFADGNVEYEETRDINLTPSLAEMTSKSIDILSQNPNGFFLMVEGGRIDHASHDYDKVGVALETIAFDDAVEVALSYVEAHSNTVLIVTADHETSGLMITGDSLDNELPSQGSTELAQRAIRISRANSINLSWTSYSHTDANVPLFLFGRFFEQYSLDGTIDNTEVYDIMDDFFSSEVGSIPPLFTIERGIIAAGGVIMVILIAYFIRLRKTNPEI